MYGTVSMISLSWSTRSDSVYAIVPVPKKCISASYMFTLYLNMLIICVNMAQPAWAAPNVMSNGHLHPNLSLLDEVHMGGGV